MQMIGPLDDLRNFTMKKVIYSCDICRDPADRVSLVGLNFSGMKRFKIDTVQSTDGVHICIGCLKQLQEQLAGMDLSPTGTAQ